MKQLFLLPALFILGFKITYAQPGTLDSSFGNRGIVRSYLGVNYNFGGGSVSQILVEPNGSIFFTQGNIAKRLPDGSADTTYGFNGFSSSAGFDIKKAALQPDGKMVAVGKADVTVRPGDYLYNFGVARFNTNGTLDSSFSGDGKLTTNFKTITNDDGTLTSVEEADAVAIQKDGKILVAGVSNNYLCLARYNPDGSLDSTFDGDGLLNTYAWNQYYVYPNLLALQSDGKIVLAERSNGIFRLNADGSSDNSYSTDNQNYQNQLIFSAAMQDDGKVITSSTYSSGGKDYTALARYDVNGRRDSTFSSDGKVITDLVFGQLSLQSNGGIIGLVGTTLKRYNADGSADKTFGDHGKRIVDFGVGQTNDYPPLALTTQFNEK